LTTSTEDEAAMEEMERIAGYWFLGPAEWRAVDTE